MNEGNSVGDTSDPIYYPKALICMWGDDQDLFARFGPGLSRESPVSCRGGLMVFFSKLVSVIPVTASGGVI